MKVFSDAPNVSALDTWLRDAGTGETTQLASAAADSLPNAASSAALRDTAEALLDANIWEDGSGSSRQLVSTGSEPTLIHAQQAASAAQRWADHIFAPLR